MIINNNTLQFGSSFHQPSGETGLKDPFMFTSSNHAQETFKNSFRLFELHTLGIFSPSGLNRIFKIKLKGGVKNDK